VSPYGSIRKLPLVVFALTVCAAGVLAGGAWGAVAGARLLRRGGIGGAIFGATTGLLAAALWCRFMLPQIVRAKRPHTSIMGYGLKWGGAVGAAAGLIVYVWLILNRLSRNPALIRRVPMLMGQAVACAAFGGCVGMLTGFLCGWLGWQAAKYSLPLPPLDPKLYPQHHITPLTFDRPASPQRTDESNDRA